MMLYTQLKQIRNQLNRREIKVSDALLLSLRALRGQLPEERLLWLNRELLGYRQEDLSALVEKKNKFPQISLLWAPNFRRSETAPPDYRFLSGTWGRVDDAGQLVCVTGTVLAQRNIFCNIGIQQIETQLEEMDDPLSGLLSMSYDENTGAEFFCLSKELVRIYDAVQFKLAEFIDEVIDDLKLDPHC